MAILYKTLSRSNPLDRSQNLFYGTKVSAGKCSLETIAQEISEYAGQSQGTVIGILRDLNTKLIQMVQQSYGIDMGNVGKLKGKIWADTTSEEDEFTADNIYAVGVRLVPSTRLKGEIALDSGNVEFVKYE